MCLIGFAIGMRVDCPLLLAGNRDEFFDRPTEPLHRWTDGSGIWAGRDRQGGGTWLGISDSGRVALLTNVRSADPGPGVRSRGELVTRWLSGAADIPAFAQTLDPRAYGGFNLVVGDLRRDAWSWLSNRNPAQPHTREATPLHRQALAPGVYGLSNAALDTPWPKTQSLKAALRRALALCATGQTPDDWQRPLEQTLADIRVAPDPALPATGVALPLERQLSSPFVRAPERGYGTRSSLLMRVTAAGAQRCADLHEWTHSPAGWSGAAATHHRLHW